MFQKLHGKGSPCKGAGQLPALLLDLGPLPAPNQKRDTWLSCSTQFLERGTEESRKWLRKARRLLEVQSRSSKIEQALCGAAKSASTASLGASLPNASRASGP